MKPPRDYKLWLVRFLGGLAVVFVLLALSGAAAVIWQVVK